MKELMQALDYYDWGTKQDKKSEQDNFELPAMSERIMDALCEDGRGDLLLLKDDEVRKWWGGVLKRREAAARKEAAARRKADLRESALSKLTAAERKALGL
jgi:hypothetical protein